MQGWPARAIVSRFIDGIAGITLTENTANDYYRDRPSEIRDETRRRVYAMLKAQFPTFFRVLSEEERKLALLSNRDNGVNK